MKNCPECGTPLEEVPLTKCRFHAAYREDALAAERAQRDARPLSQKIREAEHFGELQEILADHFCQMENEA